jgi:hypothetical protein
MLKNKLLADSMTADADGMRLGCLLQLLTLHKMPVVGKCRLVTIAV